jgi:hypothetical protein
LASSKQWRPFGEAKVIGTQPPFPGWNSELTDQWESPAVQNTIDG